MRVWLRVAWVCALAVGCGGPLPTSDEGAPDEGSVSAQWKKPLPALGPAFLLRDIFPPPTDPFPGPFSGPMPTELRDLDGTLVFAANDFAAREATLWRSDGTPSGTVPVREFAGGSIFHLEVVGERLFFTAPDAEHGMELWVSDGTKAGTRLVEDITPGPAGSDLSTFAAVGDRLFFVRTVRPSPTDSEQLELWRSDGTETGTVLVRNLGPRTATSGPDVLTALGDLLIFSNEDPEHGRELWRSDGTEAGTRLVKDIFPGVGSSRPFFLTPAGGVLYFSAEDPVHGRELWRTDGTAKGTVLVEDVRPGPESSGAQPLTVLEERLFIAAFEPDNSGVTLRKLNPDPTCRPRSQRVAFIANPFVGEPNEVSVFVSSFAVSGQKLFFTLFYDNGSPAPRHTQLWRTDGTRQGTKLLHEPLVVSPDVAVANPVPTGDGRVVFNAFDAEHGHELWVSDGMPSGTRLLQDIAPGPASSFPQELIRSDGFAYFVANDGVHGREVWALPLPGEGAMTPAAGR